MKHLTEEACVKAWLDTTIDSLSVVKKHYKIILIDKAIANIEKQAAEFSLEELGREKQRAIKMLMDTRKYIQRT